MYEHIYISIIFILESKYKNYYYKLIFIIFLNKIVFTKLSFGTERIIINFSIYNYSLYL